LHGEEEQAPTTRLNNNTKEKRKKNTKAAKTDLKRHGLGLISSSDELLGVPNHNARYVYRYCVIPSSPQYLNIP